MSKSRPKPRRIALFVEGHTERQSLKDFFHRWLDPQLPVDGRVGISPVRFQGVSNFLDDLPQKVSLFLENGKANVVVGLVDLYGLPPNRIDLSKYSSVREKVVAAREYVRRLVPQKYQDRFRQHFAVHEVEAWLLAYPDEWPSGVRPQIKERKPEEVNFDEPPAKFLKRILGRYKKVTAAKNIFSKVDPQVAFDQCPFFRLLLRDLLEIAKRLQ